ncbi:MAG: hypothetical protein ACOYLH_04945 [Flavobacteriales bacterium]|jgi:hypothetical protein
MRNKITLVAICAFLLVCLSYSANAQSTSTSNSNLMYVECSAITPEKYGELLTRLKNHPDFEVGEACVPAHVITLKLKHSGDLNQLFSTFKTATSSVQLGEVKLLADFNDEKFMNRCSQARLGH